MSISNCGDNVIINTRSSKRLIYPSPVEALKELKSTLTKNDAETVNMVVALNVDVKRGDQNVRGIFSMPGGSNKIPKVIVFTSPQFQDMAKQAGADIIGNEDTVKEIQEGKIEFEKCICTLEMLPLLKPLGKILGPKGLMPSTKVGTATTSDKLQNIIKDIKTGSREFKVDIYGQVCSPIGRKNFDDKNIYKNIDAFMKILLEKKPDNIKGRYFLYAFINTRGKSYRVDLRSLDPKSSAYFYTKIGN